MLRQHELGPATESPPPPPRKQQPAREATMTGRFPKVDIAWLDGGSTVQVEDGSDDDSDYGCDDDNAALAGVVLNDCHKREDTAPANGRPSRERESTSPPTPSSRRRLGL